VRNRVSLLQNFYDILTILTIYVKYVGVIANGGLQFRLVVWPW